jgi:DNA-binding MarR family transcriptional regulator
LGGGVDRYQRLAGELTLLLRGMKALHAHVVEEADLPCELAGTYVLGRLAALGPVRLTRLAQELGLDPSSVSRHVSSLERNGLVTRERDPHDLRAHQLVLTESGERAVADLHTARARAVRDRLPDWTAREIDELTAVLSRLNTQLAARPDPRRASKESA